jgi:hypothetical protein
MTLHPIPLNFLIYEENIIFFFISVQYTKRPNYSPTECIVHRLRTTNNIRLVVSKNTD